MNRQRLLWILLALGGLVVAVGVSYAASKLSEPRVGLASEPLSAGTKLAPARTTTAEDRAQPRRSQKRKRRRNRNRGGNDTASKTPPYTQTTPAAPAAPAAPAPAAPAPAPSAPAPSDDSSHGGDDSGGGNGSNHPGDD